MTAAAAAAPRVPVGWRVSCRNDDGGDWPVLGPFRKRPAATAASLQGEDRKQRHQAGDWKQGEPPSHLGFGGAHRAARPAGRCGRRRYGHCRDARGAQLGSGLLGRLGLLLLATRLAGRGGAGLLPAALGRLGLAGGRRCTILRPLVFHPAIFLLCLQVLRLPLRPLCLPRLANGRLCARLLAPAAAARLPAAAGLKLPVAAAAVGGIFRAVAAAGWRGLDLAAAGPAAGRLPRGGLLRALALALGGLGRSLALLVRSVEIVGRRRRRLRRLGALRARRQGAGRLRALRAKGRLGLGVLGPPVRVCKGGIGWAADRRVTVKHASGAPTQPPHNRKSAHPANSNSPRSAPTSGPAAAPASRPEALSPRRARQGPTSAGCPRGPGRLAPLAWER